MRNVLITGFEPFGGEMVNPSALAVQALEGRSIAGHRVVARVLACVFGRAIDELTVEIERLAPALVICVGQAGGRPGITVERVAINVDDARIPDNAGKAPIDRAIVPDGPAAYFSTLPIKSMVAAMHEAKVPADVSQTAGTFVCNHVFYGLMHALASRPGVRGGFIHVPFLPEQALRFAGKPPSMPLAEMIRGLELAIETALTTTEDVRKSGGATH
jgi:pyroglutamyl-peptidase